MNTAKLYEKDFYAWTVETTQALKQHNISQIDFEHLAEEIESMGKSDFRELKNRLAVLIAHLLKWEFQPDARSSSWIGTIAEQRSSIDDVLQDSPSLKNKVPEIIEEGKIYQRATKIAVLDTGLKVKYFPQICPYSIDKLLDEDFYPEN